MRQSLIVALILGANVAIAPVAQADDPTGGYFDGTEVQCPGVPTGTESDVVPCNQAAFLKADRDLNTVYEQLMKQANAREKEYLQEMQSAWIKLKKAQCGLNQYYHRQTAPKKWESYCEAVMTIRRVQELKELGTGISW